VEGIHIIREGDLRGIMNGEAEKIVFKADIYIKDSI